MPPSDWSKSALKWAPPSSCHNTDGNPVNSVRTDILLIIMARTKRMSGEMLREPGEERVTRRKEVKNLAGIEERERMQEAMNLVARTPISSPALQKSDSVPIPEGLSKRGRMDMPRSQSRDSHLSKPNMSFSALIKDAILKSPSQRLLLHEIYESIVKNYPYFKTAGEGWKNSVRHNLSINSMFCKIPRSILDDPQAPSEARAFDESGKGKKKGCYWILRDLTSLAEERYNRYEDRRRKSLSALFAKTGLTSSTSECIRILPFTHVPNVMDIGRRYSDSYLTTPQGNPLYPMGVSLDELRRRTTLQSQAQQLHGNRAKSIYYPEIPEGDEEAPLVEIQPLAIETANTGPEMPWLATSPQLNIFEQQYQTNPYRGTTAPSYADWAALEPERNDLPQIRRASRVGPGTLPRRPIKDVWLSDGTMTATSTHLPRKQGPSQFRY